MSSPKALTLDDLTKAELIALLREHGICPSQMQLQIVLHHRYRAQYETAHQQERDAWQAYRDLAAREVRWHDCAAAYQRYETLRRRAAALESLAVRVLLQEHEDAD